MLLQDGILTFL